MISWKDIPLSALMEAYTVSNTASYLYQKFRADTAVQALGARFRTMELLDELTALVKLEAWSAEDVVKAYACLVALTFHDLREVKTLLKSVDLLRLRWAAQILALAEAADTKTSFVYVPYTPSLNEPGAASSDASTNVVEIKTAA